MKRLVLLRLLRTVPLVVLVSILAFSLLHLAPGGPAGLMSRNPKVTGEDLARIRANYGLDRPLAVQYGLWFRRVFLHFDFGRSYVTGQPVSRMILERLPATLELVGAAFLIALVAALLAGSLAATRRGGAVDQCVSLLAAAGMSVPVFWLGLMAIALFSVKTGLLPAGGRAAIGEAGTLDRLRHLLLPSLVLAFSIFASWSRYVRGAVATALDGEFVRTARAKGLAERTILFKHAMRNALLPVISVVVMQAPLLFTGAVVLETVFAWPGMGRLFYEGLQRHDYPRVLGIAVIASLLIILFNLLGDILCMIADPRFVPGEAAAPPEARAALRGESR